MADRVVESKVRMDDGLERIVARAEAGERVDAAEALRLYREAPTAVLGRLADAARARKHPERVVTYIIDRNVNYTNVCVARCNFCAFYRPVGHGDGYVLSFDEIFRKIDETIARRRPPAPAPGRPQPGPAAGLVRGPVPRREGALPGLQAARALAVGGAAHLAAVASCRRPR